LRRLLLWQAASVALAAAEGVVGLWLAVELNVPPGPAIAVLAGGVFAAAALAHRLRSGSRLLLASAVLVTALVCGGCGGAGGGSHGDRPVVVATTTQIGDWVRRVGGDEVQVHQLL